jgi:hypothetical protein
VLATTIQTGIPWLGACFIAAMVMLSVRQLAGQHTLADLNLRVIGNVRINEALAWLVAALFGFDDFNRRRLHRRDIKRLARDNSELEKRLDPHRTSSGLTPTGKTRREDKI